MDYAEIILSVLFKRTHREYYYYYYCFCMRLFFESPVLIQMGCTQRLCLIIQKRNFGLLLPSHDSRCTRNRDPFTDSSPITPEKKIYATGKRDGLLDVRFNFTVVIVTCSFPIPPETKQMLQTFSL